MRAPGGRNPLRIEGTPLAPERLLAAKLTALALAEPLATRVGVPLAWAALALAVLLILNVRPRIVAGALAAAAALACGGSAIAASGLLAAAALAPDRFTPRLPAWLLWANVLCHLGVLLAVGALPLYSSAMLAATLLFAGWPRSPLTVIYDGDCGFCEWSRRVLEAPDFERRFAFVPFQTGAGRAHGISDEAAAARLHLVAGGKVRGGFVAVRRILLYNPVTHVAIALLVLTPFAPRAAALAAFAFFFPLFEPAGEVAYGWVARRRHRLFPNAVCKVERPR